MRWSWLTIPALTATRFVSYVCGTRSSRELELSLPIQDVNILVLTDVHSWIAGHSHEDREPSLNANYGHVLSFYEKLREACNLQGRDLFFVMNGDFIDGTGLSTHPPIQLTSILEQMPWDAVNIGNHELYENSTIEYITENGFVDNWNGGYLTSNVLLVETNETIGERYKFMTGAYGVKGGGDITILTFAFLYNMNNNCEMTTVERVQDVVESDWFQSVLRGEEKQFDAIVVLAHMGADDPLVTIILDKIREICGATMPAQFITGHTHVRMNVSLDAYSESFEAGRYLDTIGFVSFSLNESDANFQHEFIDANIEVMKNVLGVSENENFVTPKGRELMDMIRQSQESLGLFEVLGCSPQNYYLKRDMDEDGSLWGFFADTLIREELFSEEAGSQNTQKLFIQSTGAFRYNLYQGVVNVNDLVSMSPFNDTIYKIGRGIQGKQFIDAFGEHDRTSHHKDDTFLALPGMVVSGDVDTEKVYEVYSVGFDQKYVVAQLQKTTGKDFFPTPLKGVTVNTLWRAYMAKNWSCEEKNTTWDVLFELLEKVINY